MAYNYDEERFLVKGSERITRDLMVNGTIYGETNKISVMQESAFNDIKYDKSKGFTYNTFYITKPNGNMYFGRFMYVPSYVEELLINQVMANLNTAPVDGYRFTGDTVSLKLSESGSVTNSFLNGCFTIISATDTNGDPISLGVNVVPEGQIITNANALYLNRVSFLGCRNMTDCFMTNNNLISGIPDDFDFNVWEYVTNMDRGFRGCENFNQPIIVPNAVTSLQETFMDCYNFNSLVTLHNGITFLGNTFLNCYNFNQPITIPSGATYMGGTFYNCKAFNQPITIPNGVTDLYSTFAHCFNFNQPITIPENVTSLSSTFYNCKAFNQTVTIPENVTNMSGTFYNCANFNQPVTIVGNNVTNMSGTFDNCFNFNQPITIPSGATYMGGTFYNCKAFNQPVTIPENVTYLRETFAECLSLNEPITIVGNNVTNMYGTFDNCTNFNQPVTIPENVTSLHFTFQKCYNFNQPVTIPENVTEMYYTFYKCTTLASSTVPIHISSSIALGDTSNYIYNCLVNNFTGIAFDPSRILNDA